MSIVLRFTGVKDEGGSVLRSSATTSECVLPYVRARELLFLSLSFFYLILLLFEVHLAEITQRYGLHICERYEGILSKAMFVKISINQAS